MKQLFLFLTLLAGLYSCQNTSTPSAPTASAAKAPSLMDLPLVTAITKEGVIQLEGGATQPIPHYNEADYMVFYLVRHCEKEEGSGDNPVLTAEGQAQAERLGRVVDNALIDLVASTNTKRTILTAETVKRWAGDPTIEIFPAMAQSDWLAEKMTGGAGKRIFYVSHSNTIPTMLNELTKTIEYKNIPENEYRHFYIAVTKGIGQTEVLHFRY